MKVEFHRAADAELRAAAIFYEDRVPGLGEQFLSEVEHACSRLGEHQALGPRLDPEHRRLGPEMPAGPYPKALEAIMPRIHPQLSPSTTTRAVTFGEASRHDTLGGNRRRAVGFWKAEGRGRLTAVGSLSLDRFPHWDRSHS